MKTKSNNLLRQFPRMEKDGQIAVLYSPGYGAGWSTWNNEEWKPLLTTHRDIVRAVIKGDTKKAGEIAKKLIHKAVNNNETYVCVLGADDLKVRWLDKGTQFEINEYDGSESIHVIGDHRYQSI